MTRCKIINLCMSHVMSPSESTYFHPRKQYRHSLAVRMWMLESRKDFRLRVANWFLWRNAKLSIYACHTRSERLSSPISTYENSADTHFRSEYECSSLVTDFRFCVCTLWGVEVKTTLKNGLKTIFVLYVLALVLSPDFHVVTPILSLY